MAAKQFLVPIDMTRLEVRNFVFHLLAAAPTTLEGLPYYNTTTHCVEFWNGTQWVTIGRLDQIDAPTADVDFNTHKITGLSPGTNGTDAVNLNQLNASSLGLSWKQTVRAASTANGTLATAFVTGATLDGVVLAAGDRILLKNQTAGAENGIRIVGAGVPARAADANTAALLLQATVGVQEGTVNADTAWQNTTNAPIVVDTTALAWAALPGVMTAGAGLTSTGATMDVGAGTGIVVNANDVAVDRVDHDNRVALRYAVDVGDGASTSIVITHNLNSLDVICSVRVKGATGSEVDCDIQYTTVNTITLVFAVAPTAAQYRAVVVG